MALKLLAEVSPQELLAALAELQHHVLGYVKSMSLKCAVDLCIPGAKPPRRHRHPGRHRGRHQGAPGQGRRPPARHGAAQRLGYLQRHRLCSQQEMASKDAVFNRVLNDAMTADSELFLEVILLDKGRIFRGLSSLVDVGGGNGAGKGVIAKAFPRIGCTVLEPGLDLPHVVGQVAGDHENLRFVAGDMFESIPPADVILLKNIIHEWGNEDCIKILQRCKEAIPAKNAGGKVIIIDMVRGSADGDRKISEMGALHNMFSMCINGAEWDEREWKRIFSNAGFGDDYKIMPVLGIYP